MELYNCTGTKYKDTCEVRCDEHFNKTISSIQCGSDGKWTNLIGGVVFFIALKSTSFVMIICVNLIGLSIQCKFHSYLTISNKDYLYYSAIMSCGAAQTPMEHCISFGLSVVFFVALKY